MNRHRRIRDLEPVVVADQPLRWLVVARNLRPVVGEVLVLLLARPMQWSRRAGGRPFLRSEDDTLVPRPWIVPPR